MTGSAFRRNVAEYLGISTSARIKARGYQTGRRTSFCESASSSRPATFRGSCVRAGLRRLTWRHASNANWRPVIWSPATGDAGDALPGQLDRVIGEEDVNAVGERPLASLDHDAADQGA
jgi:hypothetical protein